MSKRLEDLEPETRAKTEALLADAKAAGVPLVVVHTLRTGEEQDALYAKGRTAPGEPCVHDGKMRPVGTCSHHPLGATVTNAKAGESWHNFGRATDFAFDMNHDGRPEWHDLDPTTDAGHDTLPWHIIGELAEKHGLEWGVINRRTGKRYDLGHVQNRGGMTLAQARAIA